MEQIRTLAVIIARLTSSRLPKKQLKEIAGKPLIYRTLERIKKVSEIDKIILATGPEEENKELADYLKQFGVETFFHNDVNNVTGRIAAAAVYYNAEFVLTVSGDCPLADPEFMEAGLSLLMQGKCDYVKPDIENYKSLHEGIEFFTADLWKKISELSVSPVHREHPGSILKEIPGMFIKAVIIPDPAFRRKDFRISVDTAADLEFMNRVFIELGGKDRYISLKEVTELIDRKPELKEINAHVHQKKINEKSAGYLFITHADEKTGMGHLIRSITIASAMKESCAANVLFIVNKNEKSEKILKQNGIKYILADAGTLSSFPAGSLDFSRFSGIAVDVKREYYKEIENFLIDLNLPVTLIDLIPGDITGDLIAVIPSVILSENSGKENEPGISFGKEYIIIKNDIRYAKYDVRPERKGILVLSGGSSLPSPELLKELSAIKNNGITFIAGPLADERKYEQLLKEAGFGESDLVVNPPSIADYYKSCEVAVTVFGVTVYELMHLGVPAVIYDSFKESDLKIIKHLDEKNLCVNAAGLLKVQGAVRAIIESLLEDKERIAEISANAAEFIDGHGAERIAGLICRNSKQ